MKARPIDNPPNPWASTAVEYLDEIPPSRLEVFEDHSKQVVSHNDSPDVGFSWSVNPYRGCLHACAYCYARPTHQYLDFGAGTDFETKLVVKPRAAELLREHFERPSWKGETVVFSGVTDCYQPLEASMRLTRACLEVCAEYRNPVGIITKGVLIERDLDVLQQISRDARLWVSISLPFHNAEVARAMEPYAASPQRRLLAIRRLAEAGLNVAVSVAPIIPGLNDEDIHRVLTAVREAGASRAHFTLVRLPGPVKDVFEERLRAKLPLRAERVLHRIREIRGGELNDSRFKHRMRGEGLYAETIHRLFDTTARKVGLRTSYITEDAPDTFRRPPRKPPPSPQLSLF
ncbi:PA0069 family radical SAM protein [Myxococcus sp. CA051A]|uniref:PA0069 family radical SAM protein n=1 Tax=Myxococcus llanfairpwllgwyngyllgogerychwyrndrobwllllantysiliogogogochensis TaxID=2590453 RepID=A0A540X0R2_9BACT|nr:PA0069 family radical SAM protein [Myxococcus llanfairpwllgwyngyllgogerychwyrndrobwllllantysiliogogogochensis]NTX01369.1 PA0069 family radical SAM protein [Myxococcus sp. CA040A]NTX15605.1 PA0069 family radical SAM protein [Myxococcus sp. CA056]NTX32940.1 PA0069 family radical SAM protein [Myxococcus sp. CA033]NTX49964.1 PA0069 family radical SAM protein [Myxococcus sp. CA039A]NTX59996.1 PA0069 family radical SAM protein [Myxococcus sp. CA051A]